MRTKEQQDAENKAARGKRFAEYLKDPDHPAARYPLEKIHQECNNEISKARLLGKCADRDNILIELVCIGNTTIYNKRLDGRIKKYIKTEIDRYMKKLGYPLIDARKYRRTWDVSGGVKNAA